MDQAGARLSGRPPRSAVRAAVRAALADLGPGDRVVVALSGGPDSLALLSATVRVAAEQGLACEAVVVDHGLAAQSHAVAERAAQQARTLGCPDVTVIRVEVRGPGGPEAAARSARYAALDAAAQADPGAGTPAATVLIGHTRDDQAETVLLGLARGSGTRSLAGMSARAGRYRRPLLGLPRAVVRAAAAADARDDPALEPWTDPHNTEDRFTRARVRHQVLPLLEETLGPGVAAALARTAELARADADALDAWADSEWGRLVVADQARPAAEQSDGMLRLDDSSDKDLPAAVRGRLVRRWLIESGCPAGDLTAQHLATVTALLAAAAPGEAEVALPGRRWVRRDGRALRVRA